VSWWSAADELLLAAFWVLAPGAALAWAVGLRRLWILLAAPPISVGTLAGLAILLDVVGVTWNKGTALAGTAVLVAVTWAARRVLGSLLASPRGGLEPVRPAHTTLMPLLGIGVGGLASAVVLAVGMRSPEYFPQTWDTVFHLNATRWILDHGTASSLQVGLVNSPWAHGPKFYPAAWHALTSLTTTDSVVVANNAVALVLAGLIWPAGLAALARASAPRIPLLAVLAPVLGAGFQAFPTRMLTWGVLWPNALAYALVPATLACVVVALRARDDADTAGPRWSVVLVVLVAGAGIALAQPNGILVVGVLAVPYAIGRAVSASTGGIRRLIRSRRAGGTRPQGSAVRHLVAAVGPLVLLAVGLFAGYRVLRLFAGRLGETTWRGTAGTRLGVWYALSDGAPPLWDGTPAQASNLVIVALIVAGVITLAWRPGMRWLVGALVIVLGLGALAERTFSFSWVTFPWFADATRLRGIAPIVTSLVAAFGILGLAQVVARWVRPPRTVLPVAAFVSVLVVAATGGLQAGARHGLVADTYTDPLSGHHISSLVSTAELRMLERLDDELTPGAALLGNPFTGAPLAYAISDVPVVFTHMNGRWNQDAWFAAQNITAIDSDPQVCEALDRLGVQYLYVDSVAHWAFFDQPPFSGIPTGTPDVPGFERVDSGGTAAVYRITACA
jgi:hypothetical protein